jgi:hypothetical protein
MAIDDLAAATLSPTNCSQCGAPLLTDVYTTGHPSVIKLQDAMLCREARGRRADGSIYCGFASSVGAAAYERALELAQIHRVGFYGLSDAPSDIWIPGPAGSLMKVV